MSEELKNCPWCGRTPAIQPYFYACRPQEYFRVGCVNNYCDVQPRQGKIEYSSAYKYTTKNEAIAAWNKRA